MIRFAVLLPAIFAALPAMAEMTEESCRKSWDEAVALADLTAPEVERGPYLAEDGFCRIEGGSAGDKYSRLTVSALSWQIDGGEELAQGRLPDAVRIRFADVRMEPWIPNNPVMAYLVKIQTRASDGVAGTASYSWSSDTNELMVDADIDFPGDNRLVLHQRSRGLYLPNLLKSDMAAVTMRLYELSAEIETNGLFEAYLVMPLGMALLDERYDPEEQLERLKEQAKDMFAKLPDQVVPAASRQALAAMVTTMPNPKGTLTLDFTAENGLGMAEIVPITQAKPDDPAAALGRLKGVALHAGWEPTK